MNDQEKMSLKSGYIGERKRDASSTIRGFVFQNLLAVEELIKEDTDCVFCEYVEDVTSLDKKGNCRIIQAKYYSSSLSTTVEKEVFREMYCQYLKLKNKGGLKNIKPVLSAFSTKKVEHPDRDTARNWIDDNLKQIKINNLSELETKGLDKAGRESAVINSFGSKENFEEYFAAYEVDLRTEDLDKIRINLGNKLVDLLQDELEDSTFDYLGRDEQGQILLGVSYLMVLETFDRIKGKQDKEEDSILQHKQIKRMDFIKKLKSCIEEEDDQIIVKTVQSMIMEIYFSILSENPKLNQEQLQILEAIVNHTEEWIGELLCDKNGQYAFFNSVSFELYETVTAFKSMKVKRREKEFFRCFSGIKSSMKYLWKIMMNICTSKTDFNLRQMRKC